MVTITSDTIEHRVNELLSRMTLDEKLAQLGSCWVFELLTGLKFDSGKGEKIMRRGIGHITRLAGSSNLDPVAAAKTANQIQRYLIENTRLGIPALIHEECCAGHMARGATCFPQVIGLASTWEPELVRRMADVTRQQMRAAGAQQGLAPVLDVARDPRWGRTEETFGEDPYLAACMGVEFVQGLQGNDLKQGVVATGKHFVGYGVPDGGLNWNPAHIPARELREVFLFPFEAAVRQAGMWSIMHGYNELDGIPCAASRELLSEILRDQWGFEGTVVADYFGIDQLQKTHRIAADAEQSARLALEAGVDVELPTTDCYGLPLKQAIQKKQIDVALIDRSVRRILATKFALGLFENPFVDPEQTMSVFDTPPQRRLAREIAQKSMVLLKNEGGLLPLSKKVRSIAVIGPNANDVRNMIGDYAYPCHIETLVEMKEKGTKFSMPFPESIDLVDNFVPIRPILEGIAEKVSEGTSVHYARGCDVLGDSWRGIAEAVEAARHADVAVVVVGDRAGLTEPCSTGETRDRATLDLPGIQTALVQAVYDTGTPVVVVLVNGRPASIPWIAEHVPAILEAWLPGEEGAEAVADVLFGDFNPGGKLPITIPIHVGQVPTFHYLKPSGGRSHWRETYVDLSNKPLFPFGYGLSYTSFTLDNLQLSAGKVSIGDEISVSVDITNTGDVAGEQVVQLYVRDELSSVTRPCQELKGFMRVYLTPGEKKSLKFTLHTSQLAFYDREMKFVVEPGDVTIMVGFSSAELPLSATVELVGTVREVRDKVYFSRAQLAPGAESSANAK